MVVLSPNSFSSHLDVESSLLLSLLPLNLPIPSVLQNLSKEVGSSVPLPLCALLALLRAQSRSWPLVFLLQRIILYSR